MADLNCDFAGNDREFCDNVKSSLVNAEEDIDSIQMQIYIISGVGGGIALVLIVTLIALAIQLSSMRQKAAGISSKSKNMPKSPKNTKIEEVKKNVSNKNGNVQPQQPPHSYAQPPKPVASAEEELAQLGFSAYTGHPIETHSRGFSSSSPAINSAGGVRVLPRNPPPFRQNSGVYNDSYMQ